MPSRQEWDLERIANLKLLRTGLHLGTFKKNRFEPSYALAMALKLAQAKNVCDLMDEERAYQYLKGEALNLKAKKGLGSGWLSGLSVGVRKSQ